MAYDLNREIADVFLSCGGYFCRNNNFNVSEVCLLVIHYSRAPMI